MLLIRFKLPPGASIYLTQAKMTMVENYLLAQPEVSGVYSAVGGFSGASGANVNTGNDFVTLVDPRKRKLSQSALINKFRANIHRLIPDMEANFQDMSLRGFSATRGFPVEFLVRGSDWDTLTKVTFDLMSKLRKSGVVTDVNTDVQSGMPEVQITPDRSKLAARAVDLATVTSGINALMGGYIFNKEIEYPKEGHRYEIEVQLVANQRNKVQDLNLVRLRNNRGDVVPLKDVVDIQERKDIPSRKHWP
jgi:multidrug efflux pump subunit AcrB